MEARTYRQTKDRFMRQIASDVVQGEISRRTGWFRPFCLSVLILLLINTCVVGGAIVVVVRQVVTLPPGLVSAFTGGASPVPLHSTTVLDRVQSVSELVTTRYSYSSVVTSQRDLPGILGALYGDKLLMVAVGHINAGIDMKNITINDISQAPDGTMTITLRAPHLQDCFLDEQASYVVARDTGIFARPAPNLDQEARRYAVGQFRDLALKADIFADVQTNATLIVGKFVTALGVKNVNIVVAPPDPTNLPDSCK